MSGGHYDYDSSKLSYLAERIAGDAVDRSVAMRDSYGYDRPALEPEALLALSDCADALKALAPLAHAVEWFMSGDYGIESLVHAHNVFKNTQKGTY